MSIRKTARRLWESLFKQPGPKTRYLLPFLTIVAALFTQGAVSLFVPKDKDFPYAFFYLMAVFVTAWFGSYLPGAIASTVTLVGIPMLVTHSLRLTSIDLSRLVLLVGVSLLVSLVAQSQRKQRELLRQANNELDKRVRARTEELVKAVNALQSEIGQHRRTEDALRRSEQRVDLALDAAGIGRWDVDLVTGRVDRSERHNQIFGFDAQLPSPGGLFDRVLPEQRRAIEEKFQTAVESGSMCEFECPVRDQDGTVRWVWGRGRVLRDDVGKALSFLGSSRDITDRKEAEQKLKTQLERLNLLGRITRAIGERQDLPSVFQVVIRSLEDDLPVDFGCVCLYNAPAEEVVVTHVGTHSEVLAMELAMTEQANISVKENGLSQCVRGRLVYEPDVSRIDFPFPQRLARGGLRAMVAAPLRFESKVFGVLIVARREPHTFSSGECEFLQQLSEHVALAVHQSETHTALQRAYDDLRQTQQAAMQQERLRALGQMASGIAHDVNNAISPVALYMEMLLEQEPNLSSRTRECLEITQRAIGDVAHTVARMREFYRQQEPELVLAPLDLNVLVQQVIDLTRARWFDMPQKRGIVIDLQSELAQSLPVVSGIESEIREALINLVFNAVDALPEGGTLTVRTKTSGADGQMHADIEVIDTGVGMDEETRRRCLEPFFTTKGERGTGLGLAMVYGVTQRHNAAIEIESTVGSGTMMRLRFPARDSWPAETSAAPETIPPRMRILSVDDDPLLIKSLRDVLEADGHTVVTAYGGQEGIDAFRAAQDRNERFAVVITDLGMPHIDGRTVANAIKGDSPSTPVILLTGWGQRLIAEGDIPPNVDLVLNKPPKLRELRAALTELASLAGTRAG